MDSSSFQLPDLRGLITAAIGRIRLHSGLNPTLWLAGLIAIPAFLLSLFTNVMWLSVVLVSLGGIVIVNAIIAFWYVLLRAPALLRSEDHQIRRAAIEMLGEKGAEFLPLAGYVASIAKPREPGSGGTTSGDING